MNIETIHTPRLLLQGFSPQAMNELFTQYPKAEIQRILGHRSEEAYQTDLYKHQNGYSSYNRSFLLFLLTHKTDNLIIGRCGIHNWNKDHRRAEIGYMMEDEQYRRAGLMSEAVEAIVHYGFQALQLHRIEALVGVNNVASLSIMRRFGFVQEGVLREHQLDNGHYEDSILFSKLQHEYGA
ncbi:MAG TPA: GNAT family protein [Saprospiraceae bacterium]|nr:GNAT family protein [Saprospiraceae bacterium]